MSFISFTDMCKPSCFSTQFPYRTTLVRLLIFLIIVTCLDVLLSFSALHSNSVAYFSNTITKADLPCKINSNWLGM